MDHKTFHPHAAPAERRDFLGRDLRGATFQAVELGGAVFDDVDLHGATIRDANLSGAHLRGVDLSESEWTDVNLAGVTIRDAHVAGLVINGVDVGALIAAQESAAPSHARPIVHLDLPTAERSATARFYRELFGWECGATDAQTAYTTFWTGNMAGGFPNLRDALHPAVGAMRAGDAVLYLPSDDLEADLAHAEGLGGLVLLPRTEVADGLWVALLTDPNGVRLALATCQPPRM